MSKKTVKRKKWTADDDALIRLVYPKGYLPALAAHFNVKDMALYGHARNIGVRRDPELVLKQNQALGKKLAAANIGKRFVKGITPANKGKKQTEFMSPEKIEATKATRFKAGLQPHNYKPIGYERITTDGYTEVKVRDRQNHSEKNFELKQRLIYTEHNGPIPEGCMIEFIDGNKQNFAIDNLRCVTRAQNATRNIKTYHALPADIKENVKLLNKLKKVLQ